MADSPVEQYQQQLKVLLDVRNRIEKMAKTISSGASGMRDWKRLHIKNTSVKFPSAIVTDPTCHGIDAEVWPSGEDLATALKEWRDALEAAKSLWNELADDQKVGFLEPGAY